MIKKDKVLLMILILTALVLSVYVPNGPTNMAYGASGTSKVQIASTEMNISAGGSAATNYTVKLVSGTTWGTNLNYKAPTGISASFSVPTGDPTFSGVMTVSAATSMTAGHYVLTVYATGDDPSGDTNVTVNVASQAAVGGNSSIAVSPTSLNITAGNSAKANYTVSLTSGTAGSTTVEYKSTSPGISASFSNPSGTPTFTGTVTVSVSSSVSPGSYVLSLYATGSDPSSDTNITVTVASPTVIKELTLYSEKIVQVNATSGKSYSVSVNTPSTTSSTGVGYSISEAAFSSYNLTVLIKPGTYAMINGSKVTVYNFTLATFNPNSSFPAQSSSNTTLFFFLFEVNGQVSGHISFVNSSGDDVPVITEINAPSNWTSWTFLGGSLIDNGNAYNYNGGYYAFANTWTYNSSSKELVNDQFVSPVPWVFLEPAKSVSTTTTPSYFSSMYLYIIIIVIVIVVIIAVVAVALRARNKTKK